MKKEFEKLIPIWGISKQEAEKIDKLYDDEKSFVNVLNKRKITFLPSQDIKRLLKYYGSIKCVGCRLEIIKNANDGICIFCGVRN